MRRQSQRKFVTKGFALNSFKCEPSFSFSMRGVDPFGSVTFRIYFRPKKFLRCSSSSLRCFLQFFTSISSIYQAITCTKSLLNHARFKIPRPLTVAFVRLHAVKKKIVSSERNHRVRGLKQEEEGRVNSRFIAR